NSSGVLLELPAKIWSGAYTRLGTGASVSAYNPGSLKPNGGSEIGFEARLVYNPAKVTQGTHPRADASRHRLAFTQEQNRRSTSMKITVLGGDGYCGWATALYLSNRGHAVSIVDSFARRHWDHEPGVQPLTPIRPLTERLRMWQQLTGCEIPIFAGDITDYAFLSGVMEELRPDAVVHFAEQRAAPYSMIDRQHAVFT